MKRHRDLKEIFKIYDIDRQFNVTNRSTGQKLSVNKASTGYLTVSIKVAGVVTNIGIHRMMAFKFVPNPHNYKCVNHKDGDKENNDPPNLEWCTSKHNSNHASKTGLIKSGTKNYNHRLTEANVRKIISSCNSWSDCIEMSKEFGVTPECVNNVWKYKTWRHFE